MKHSVESFLIEAGVRDLKRSGDNMLGLCPFHSDHHRSFSMNTLTGKFICFSESCGVYGGLLSFLMNACDYSFKRARKEAENFGAVLERSKYEDVSLDFPSWAERRRAVGEPEMEDKFLALYDFCPKYMLKRGFLKEFLLKWEVGYDHEDKKVTLPVRDHSGRLVGLTKRATDDSFPKYLHLKFQKSHILYGEHLITSHEDVWVVEGQLDAIAVCQLGYGNVVSTMGSRVGTEQIRRLNRFSHVFLAFDDDDDGVSATKRAGDQLIAWGKRDVFVARCYLEDVKDPADMLFVSPRKVKRLFKHLEPYDTWRLDN